MTDDGIELSPTRQCSADIMPMGNPSQSCDNYTAVQQAVSSLDGLEGERGKVQVLAIMVALCLSLFIAALDQTIVSTSLPTISSRLHSASGYTWVGGAYLLASAAAAPIWAKLSDIWGRKPILLVAVLWFMFSSIVCAAAVNMRMLIAGRALQGIAGGGLLQLVMIVVSDLFSVIGGAGSAILFAPPLIALQAMVAQDDTASATAMLGFIRTIAMSVSIVVGGVVFQNSMAGERSRLEAAGLMDEIVEELTGASAAASTEVIKTLNDPSKIRTVAGAFSSSLQNMWIMYTCMAGVAVLASAFIVNQPLSEEHTETRTGLKEE
ncbi:hypothetical protein AFCA_008342 [Aspergillus flavus]|nr:hypothetical protein AFCA_008342 [Aspergillus flavus]